MGNSKKYLLFILLGVISNLFSQNNNTDSLRKLIQYSKVDTIVLKANNSLTEIEGRANPSQRLVLSEFGIHYADSCLKHSNLSAKHKRRIIQLKAESVYNKAAFFEQKSDGVNALTFYKMAVDLQNECDDKRALSYSYNDMGNVYYRFGDFKTASEYHSKALKLREDLNDKKGVAQSLSNLSTIYNFDKIKSREYLEKSFKIRMEIKDKRGVAICYNGFATLMKAEDKIDSAIYYCLKSIEINKEIKNTNAVASNYNLLASLYRKQNKIEESIGAAHNALQISLGTNNKVTLSNSYNHLGESYLQKNNLDSALFYGSKGLSTSKEIGYPANIAPSSLLLFNIYKQKKDADNALIYFELFKKMQDSINNDEARKTLYKSQFKYDFEKREAIAKAEFEKNEAITQAELANKRQENNLLVKENALKQLSIEKNLVDLKQKEILAENQKRELEILDKDKKLKEIEASEKEVKLKSQRNILYGLSVGAILIIGMLFISIRGYLRKRKDNQIINQQKFEVEQQREILAQKNHLIEEKQKEILDSINYAKRIQYTLLAHDQYLKDNLKEHFVLFNPKDIVSGDFYWATKQDGRFYLAACDSTGHGIPGAFMSLLNIGFLSEAINEKGITKPNEVFNYVRQKLTNTVSRDGQKDGFDGILVCFDRNSVTYAAANNAPIIIRNGEVIELEADRMPVGVGERKQDFVLQTIQLEKGDSLYLYTDGFADQFGGPKGKKFKYKQLNELLAEISVKLVSDQKEILQNAFNSWRGDLEQVDDVCVIGIKI